MIFSENQKPTLADFTKLCVDAENLLNTQASNNPNSFLSKGAQKLEPIVLEAMNECAIGTEFAGTLELVSGLKFPDIVANKYYGVEVKSTKENKWQVIGGSVAEGTRIEDVENIFLMFGKLHNPVQFKTRRYQDCLYDVAVTHSPRYKIDMQLAEGETIFDKMGIDYDTLRKKENPLEDVVNYYRTQLQPGESLWWINNERAEPKSVPMKISLWKNLSAEEKNDLTVKALVLFPEIFRSRSTTKYERLAVWLVNEFGIVAPSLRDSFSAGGQISVKTNHTIYTNVPKLFEHVINDIDKIRMLLLTTDITILKDFWKVPQNSNVTDPLNLWCNLVAEQTNQKIGTLLRSLLLNQEIVNVGSKNYDKTQLPKNFVSDTFY